MMITQDSHCILLRKRDQVSSREYNNGPATLNPNQCKFVIKDHSHKVSIFFLALESNFVCLAMEYYMLDLFVQRVNGAY